MNVITTQMLKSQARSDEKYFELEVLWREHMKKAEMGFKLKIMSMIIQLMNPHTSSYPFHTLHYAPYQ